MEASYRSGLEKKIAEQLTREGIRFSYESEKLPYTVPARDAKYIPDFPVTDTVIYLEGKGRFGGHQSDNKGAQERQKLILVKEQHPELDIRIVFQNSKKPIYKGSKTTYAKWAEDHGFLWADKGLVPKQWLDEIRKQQRKRG